MATPLSVHVNQLLLRAAETGSAVTGRKIVTFRQEAQEASIGVLRTQAGMRVAHSADFGQHALNFSDLGDADAVVLSEIGVAIVAAADPGRMNMAAAAPEFSSAVTVEDEYIVFSFDVDPSSYLRGFRAAAERIADDLLSIERVRPGQAPATWGIQAVRAQNSSASGAGIKVAMLDTGFDLHHPDFAGRSITSQSFISGEPVQDLNGHGTHTTGTACGPLAPGGGIQRYGIAYQALIFSGKVLSNAGSGVDAGVLAGINWAVANRCEVVSMSLGAQGPVSTAYEQAGQRALAAGGLIIAAAGNDSTRPQKIAPTGRPANSPSFIAVAAVDEQLQVAPFSNGGKIEIAGPGVNVFSSVPMPKRYDTYSGTSMATPHVSGCAALLAQTNPKLRAMALRNALLANARGLGLPATDVGAGLVQAV